MSRVLRRSRNYSEKVKYYQSLIDRDYKPFLLCNRDNKKGNFTIENKYEVIETSTTNRSSLSYSIFDDSNKICLISNIEVYKGDFKIYFTPPKEIVGLKGIDYKEIDNKFLITSDGKVYSLNIDDFLVLHTGKRGYVTCRIHEHTKPVHRFVALAFIPNPLNLPYVNHKNGIKTDNRVENLEWCTAQQNYIHALENGLLNISKGEKHTNSKLTNNEVLEIKKLLKEGNTLRSISKIFNVNSSTISNIKTGRTRKHA